jgi:phosphatidylserine/phosphatidylglycerophosphate/cardiolipin synthase-like enzyme
VQGSIAREGRNCWRRARAHRVAFLVDGAAYFDAFAAATERARRSILMLCQKVVVVDDAVAFVGGFDIAACRWDTPRHLADDPRRVDPGYGLYAPFHDIQVVVDGEAATALGDLVRERWQRATGRPIPPPRVENDAWPAGVAVELHDVRVAIARTEPRWDGRPAVHEVEALHLDAIAAARRSIYLRRMTPADPSARNVTLTGYHPRVRSQLP